MRAPMSLASAIPSLGGFWSCEACYRYLESCYKDRMVKTKEFDMPPEWAAYHARPNRTTSSTLRPAAFPSLLFGQPPPETPPEELPEIDPELIEESHTQGLDNLYTAASSPAQTASPGTERLSASPESEKDSAEDDEDDAGGAIQDPSDSTSSANTLSDATPPPSPSQNRTRKRRRDRSPSVSTTALLSRKHTLESELTALHKRLSLPPTNPPPEQLLPSPPSSTELTPPDPNLLKQEIEGLNAAIWRLKHQTRHMLRARRDFFAARGSDGVVPAPAPSVPEGFKESRCQADRLKMLPRLAPPERLVFGAAEFVEIADEEDAAPALDAGQGEEADYFAFSGDAPYSEMWWRMEMGNEPFPDPFPLEPLETLPLESLDG